MRGNRLVKLIDFYAGSLLVLLVAPFVRRQQQLPDSVDLRNILVIKLAAMGDTLLLMSSLAALRNRYPNARITVLGTSINEEIVGQFPNLVDWFMTLDVRRIVRKPWLFLKSVGDLRRERFDMVFDFEQWSFITPLLCALSGIPYSVGFRIHKPVRHLLYDVAVERKKETHEARNFFNLLTVVGIDSGFAPPTLAVDESERRLVRAHLARAGWNETRPLVVVHPGCGAHGFPREWPIASYVEFCERLKREWSPFFVFTGGGSEEHLAKSLAEKFSGGRMHWKNRKLSALIALIAQAKLFVSGNNGVMHIAAALGVPQIALHGPTDSAKWGPLNDGAVVIRSRCPQCPCLDLGHEYHRTDGYCMRQIPVEEVVAASLRILRQ